MKIFYTVSKLWSGHDFYKKKLSKGHNSVKNVGGVSVLVLCTSSDDGYICIKFHENILNGIRVMELQRKVNGRPDGQTDGWTDRRRARHNTTRLRRAYKNLLFQNHLAQMLELWL